jgi:hypothetical protein
MREGAQCSKFWSINRIGAEILVHKSYEGVGLAASPPNFCSVNRMGGEILGRESYGGGAWPFFAPAMAAQLASH